MELQLRFLTPTMVRVTLRRPGHDEPLLDHAFAKTSWPPVAVRVTEERHQLTLRSDSMALLVHRRPCRIDLLDSSGKR